MMKSSIFTFLSAWNIQHSFAGMAYIDQMLTEWSHNSTNSPQTRGAMISATSTLRNIENYGCYCFFDEHHTKGSGLPKNDIDQRCFSLHKGYSCAKIDGNCDAPWTASYQVVVGFDELYGSATPENVAISQCNSFGNTGCELNACIIEVNFAVSMFRDPSFIFQTYDQSFQNLDHSLECPKQAGDSAEISCCGDYPTRKPFKTEVQGSSRGCCGNTVYDSDMYCCSGSAVQILGTCSP